MKPGIGIIILIRLLPQQHHQSTEQREHRLRHIELRRRRLVRRVQLHQSNLRLVPLSVAPHTCVHAPHATTHCAAAASGAARRVLVFIHSSMLLLQFDCVLRGCCMGCPCADGGGGVCGSVRGQYFVVKWSKYTMVHPKTYASHPSLFIYGLRRGGTNGAFIISFCALVSFLSAVGSHWGCNHSGE